MTQQTETEGEQFRGSETMIEPGRLQRVVQFAFDVLDRLPSQLSHEPTEVSDHQFGHQPAQGQTVRKGELIEAYRLGLRRSVPGDNCQNVRPVYL